MIEASLRTPLIVRVIHERNSPVLAKAEDLVLDHFFSKDLSLHFKAVVTT
jgi:hypothetical protein